MRRTGVRSWLVGTVTIAISAVVFLVPFAFIVLTAGNVVLFILVTLIVYPLFRYFNSKEVDL